MSLLPTLGLWLVLAASAGLMLPLRNQPRSRNSIAVLSPVLALLLWYAGRPQAGPLTSAAGGWQWTLDATGWQLTGILLVLLLAAALWEATESAGAGRPRKTLSLSGLALAALPLFWAGDAQTQTAMLALAVAGWLVASGLAAREPTRRTLWSALALGAAVFLLWFATAGGDPYGTTLGAAAAWVAVLILLGAWPFGAWRDAVPAVSRGTDALLLGIPLLAGVDVMVNLTASWPAPTLHVPLLTILGFMAVLAGVLKGWRELGQAEGPAVPLAAAAAGFLLLAGVWSDTPSLLAAARLAVFLPAIIYLLVPRADDAQATNAPDAPQVSGIRRVVRPDILLVALAFLALAGAPLTVGWAALTGLYASWLTAGRILLLMLFALLLAFWLALVLLFGRVTARDSRGAGARTLLRMLPALAAAAGLIFLAVPALPADGRAPILAALLLPPGLALALLRFSPWLLAQVQPLDAALAVSLPLAQTQTGARRVVAGLSAGLADALSILEGPLGLVWALALIALLVWLA